MPLSIDMQLTFKDLESYIKMQLSEPRNAKVDMDPVLDILLHSKRRLANGDYMPRVVSEAMLYLDDYFLEQAELEAYAV